MNKHYLLTVLAGILATCENPYSRRNEECQDVNVVKFRCRDCVHYKSGKTYCKIIKHSISSGTIADNCNAFVKQLNGE